MIRTLDRPARAAVVVLLLLAAQLPLAGGCAFDREWKRLAAAERGEAAPSASAFPAPADARADKLAGRWEGTWRSERSNHSGKLRAIVTPIDAQTYRADFDATYMGLMRFGYSMKLAAQSEADQTRFQGAENLGWLAGGLYRYDGAADGHAFNCTYRSRNDHGTFRMTRPPR